MKMLERTNQTKYIFLELLAVAFLATGGIFVKLSALGPVNTGFYRVLFSLPILFPFVYKDLKKMAKKDILILLIAGAFLAGDVSLWNLSFRYTSVANANLLANLTPFTVIPISFFVFKEKVPKLFWLGLGATLLGVFVLIGGKVNPVAGNYFGDLLALCTSFFYAGFLLISYRMRDHVKSTVIMFVSGIGSAVTLLASASSIEGVQVPLKLQELWPILGLTFCLQLIGHNLLTHCQGKVSINLSSIICLSQPAIASIYSFIIFSETISMKEILGIAIVIAGVYLVKLQYTQNK